MHSQLHRGSGFAALSAPNHGRKGRSTARVVTTAATQATTRVRYSKGPADEKGNLFFYTTPPPPEVGRVTNLEPDEVLIDLHDLRVANGMTLERNGFELVKFPGGLGVNWQNEGQVKAVYYAEVESLLKKVSGAARVHVMSHGFRRDKVQKGEILEFQMPGPQDPATLTHVDFTDISAAKVLHQHMGDEAEKLSKKPWGIIQVWHPEVGPVQDSPLGLVDAATFSPEDAMSVDVHTPVAHLGIHKVTFVAHNPNHRWFYTSQMQTNEAYVFMGYDSRDDGRAKFTPHGAIADSSIPNDAPKRQSIEARALVFWD